MQDAEIEALKARLEQDSGAAVLADVAEREAALEAALLDARQSLQAMRARQEATQGQLMSMQVLLTLPMRALPTLRRLQPLPLVDDAGDDQQACMLAVSRKHNFSWLERWP